MTTQIKLKGGSRYVGEVTVTDDINGKRYLGDLIFYQGLGHDLTGWTLVGTTAPTIAANGKIDLFDNVGGIGTASAYRLIPGIMGKFDALVVFNFTRMNDDTSTVNAIIQQFGPTFTVLNGLGWLTTNIISQFAWRNAVYGGTLNNFTVPFVPTVNVEHVCCLVMEPQKVLVIIDGIPRYTMERSNKGTATLDSTPNNSYFSANKLITIYSAHIAGQVSHYQVKEIAVARLVGQGAL